MKYKVRKTPGLRGIKNLIKFYLLGNYKRVVKYHFKKENENNYKRVTGDFTRLLVIRKYIDENNNKIYRETEYENHKMISNVIIKKGNHFLLMNKLEGKVYGVYEKELKEDISCMLKDKNIIYSALIFLTWKKKREVLQPEIKMPKFSRIKKLN